MTQSPSSLRSLHLNGEWHAALSTAEEIIDEARNGRMFILVDDEDRENEGDLVIPAQMVTPDAINFMAKYGRGLICLALSQDRVRQLDLPLMSPDNGTRHQTAFTVSIEAKEGVTTGISAADRARTVQVAIDPARGKGDIVTPGHIFPLMARDGGVLVRAGHTEAAVDIARLAGLIPAGVICEIMNEDGTMARLPDLVGFAQLHNIKIGTIADLIGYRRRKDTLIEPIADTRFESDYGGEWTLRVYVNRTDGVEHLALIHGEIDGSKPVMVRVHSVNPLDDLFGRQGGRAHQLHAAMVEIARHGSGAVILPRESDSNKVSHRLAAPAAPAEAARPSDNLIRTYGIGCLMLLDLSIRELILLTNSKQHHFVGMEGFGLSVVEERPIPPLRPGTL